MEKNIRVIGQISVILLFVVFLWQGSWLYKVRKMKIEEVHENANYILKSILDCYLSNEELILFSEKCELSVSLNVTQDTFNYSYNGVKNANTFAVSRYVSSDGTFGDLRLFI